MILVSVIIPLFNEEENIDFLIGSLNSFFERQKQYKAEVIFVNDGSADSTLQKLKHASHQAYSCKIINFSKNYGSHAALRAGIIQSSGDYVTFMYADLQDPLEIITRQYNEIIKGYDTVWAYRESVAISGANRVFSRMYSTLMKKYAIDNFPKTGFDVVMFNHKIRTCLNENVESNSSIFIQILSFGFRQTNIYYDKQIRKFGKSKWTLSKKIKLFIDSFAAFSYVPIRLVSIIGISFFIIGAIGAVYIICRKLFFNDLSSGWPALISILMIGFGITNISLGIIAEYLWRTLDATRKRPPFIIDEVILINNDSE